MRRIFLIILFFSWSLSGFCEDFNALIEQQQAKAQEIMQNYAKQMASSIPQTSSMDVSQKKDYGNVLIFVSFSMPDVSLRQWLQQASLVHAPLFIRGLYHNSFNETRQRLSRLISQKGQGVLLDPTRFTTYHITQVPAVVVTHPCLAESCGPSNYDVVYGNVSLEAALENITNRGTAARAEAKNALQSLNEAKKHGE